MITLNELFRITDKEKWTVCLNVSVEENIYSLLDDNETSDRKSRLMQHISWKKKYGDDRSFRIINTPCCLQFLQIKGYNDRWLFLGAFDCVGSITIEGNHEIYDLKRRDEFDEFSERLIVKYKKNQGPKQAKLEWDKYLSMEVIELLPNTYSLMNKTFPGYDNICLSFSEMRNIFLTPYRNWQEALSIINGIYVITDLKNGKQYVGSTYGDEGVWQRWSSYVDTNGHGGDEDLKPLIKSDKDYALKYFQFSLVEYFFNTGQKRENKNIIIARESHWKEVLKTRKFGYNLN